jgi:hypothetical protein
MGDTFHLKSSDTAPVLEASLTDANEEPIDLTGADVAFELREPRNGATVVDAGANVADTTGGVVRYPWADGDTDEAGRYRGQFVVTFADGSVETFPNVAYHDIIISE